jgi:hypothetical protein
VKKSEQPYTSENSGNFSRLIQFDCRGLEPVSYQPRVREKRGGKEKKGGEREREGMRREEDNKREGIEKRTTSAIRKRKKLNEHDRRRGMGLIFSFLRLVLLSSLKRARAGKRYLFLSLRSSLRSLSLSRCFSLFSSSLSLPIFHRICLMTLPSLMRKLKPPLESTKPREDSRKREDREKQKID